MMNHLNGTVKRYHKLLRADNQSDGCHFCRFGNTEPILDENSTMLVVSNRTKYDVFEGFRVADHLMIVPKQHRESMAEFTADEVVDYMALVAKYESLSYGLYARGVNSLSRSVAHQHTHLIKLSTAIDVALYVRKPYRLYVK